MTIGSISAGNVCVALRFASAVSLRKLGDSHTMTSAIQLSLSLVIFDMP